MGVSTVVSLPSGSSEEIRVGSNPVTCTKQERKLRQKVLTCVFIYIITKRFYIDFKYCMQQNRP